MTTKYDDTKGPAMPPSHRPHPSDLGNIRSVVTRHVHRIVGRPAPLVRMDDDTRAALNAALAEAGKGLTADRVEAVVVAAMVAACEEAYGTDYGVWAKSDQKGATAYGVAVSTREEAVYRIDIGTERQATWPVTYDGPPRKAAIIAALERLYDSADDAFKEPDILGSLSDETAARVRHDRCEVVRLYLEAGLVPWATFEAPGWDEPIGIKWADPEWLWSGFYGDPQSVTWHDIEPDVMPLEYMTGRCERCDTGYLFHTDDDPADCPACGVDADLCPSCQATDPRCEVCAGNRQPSEPPPPVSFEVAEAAYDLAREMASGMERLRAIADARGLVHRALESDPTPEQAARLDAYAHALKTMMASELD